MMNSDDKLASERLRGRVEYWKQIASIQIHFNDMCIRTRWLGLIAIATLVAAAAIAEKEDIRFRLPCEWTIGRPSVLMVVGLMLLTALWFLDIHYYYNMLIASVEHGERFEKKIMPYLQVEDEGITSYISQKISRRRAWFVSRVFYILVGGVLIIFLVGSFLPQTRLTTLSKPI